MLGVVEGILKSNLILISSIAKMFAVACFAEVVGRRASNHPFSARTLNLFNVNMVHEMVTLKIR